VTGVVPRRRLRLLESPDGFARACLRLAGVLAIFGVVGVGNRLVLLPLAGVAAVFAALARLADTDRFDDPVDADDPVEVLDTEALVEPEPEPEPEPEVAAEPDPAAEPEVAAEPVLVSRTFRLPVAVGAERVALVGEFNGWSHEATPMQREGAWFTATVELEPGRAYRYRYLLDGVRWENDWAPDAYVPNEYGTDDSLVHT
jgi:hypothetical protein